jgi:hypothetical protein
MLLLPSQCATRSFDMEKLTYLVIVWCDAGVFEHGCIGSARQAVRGTDRDQAGRKAF